MSIKVPLVEIALATYNGAPFLGEMLASIAAQDYHKFGVVLSDDGSTDETVAIAKSFERSMEIKIVSNEARKGVLRNFEAALVGTSAPYILLCDQDDYWVSDKVSVLLARLQALEASYSNSTPLLVFSDIEVVDKDLKKIKSSIYDNSIKSSNARLFEDFFLSSHVPGCSMMFNRALLELALPFPPVEIHDWWLIQLATLFGHIDYVDKPLIKYRQHESNAIGLGNPAGSAWVRRLRKLSRPFSFVSKRVIRWNSQAASIRLTLKALQDRFGSKLPIHAQALVDAGLTTPNFARLNALLKAAKAGEWRPDYYGILYLLGRR